MAYGEFSLLASPAPGLGMLREAEAAVWVGYGGWQRFGHVVFCHVHARTHGVCSVTLTQPPRHSVALSLPTWDVAAEDPCGCTGRARLGQFGVKPPF